MLGKSDAQFVSQLDERIRNVIMAPATRSDRGCILAVLRLVNLETKPEKRQALFDHFKRKAPRLDIAALESAYREVESELASKPISRGQLKLAATRARLAQLEKTVDGAPLSDG